jgi:hypothetical protein
LRPQRALVNQAGDVTQFGAARVADEVHHADVTPAGFRAMCGMSALSRLRLSSGRRSDGAGLATALPAAPVPLDPRRSASETWCGERRERHDS